jgi:hypothetical protein
MNVVLQTDTRLQIEHLPIPWIIGLGAVCLVLLIGLIRALIEGAWGGALIAAVMLAALAWMCLTKIFTRLQIIFDRDTNSLTINATSLLGEQSASYPLADLTRAEIETRHDSNSTPEPRLALVLGNAQSPQRLSADPFRPDPADLLHASERINAWLALDSGHKQKTAQEPGVMSP